MTDREKLEKIKSLADKMYTSMQNLTSDTTPIRKAMDEYHQFIINEYHKEEPTIPDIVDEHFDEMLGEESASEDLEEAAKNYMRSQNPPIWGLYHGFKAGAQWQKQQMMAKAVDGVVHRFNECGVASVHYNDPNGVPMAYFIPSEGLSAGDKVKIITIKKK